jgi:hypothetical protein
VRNDYSAFGPGAGGYARRYAAAYGNVLRRSMITRVVLPSLLKQDPRYFYKGTGSTKSRIGYAISRAVIRKGDNGHWQPNYSEILGGFASGVLSNLYYPAQDRKGVRLTFENAAIGKGIENALNTSFAHQDSLLEHEMGNRCFDVPVNDPG